MAANLVKQRGLVWPAVIRVLLRSKGTPLTIVQIADLVDATPLTTSRVLTVLKAHRIISNDFWHRRCKTPPDQRFTNRKVWFIEENP